MTDIIKKATIDFKDLIENSKININFQSQLINELNNEFTGEEQRWFIANFYVFLNYHPTEDYPINLENVYSMIGFANKGNAKRTLVNNFEENKDFMIKKDDEKQLLRREKFGGSGILHEKVLLNIDTFKMLCMLAKTDKGKKIRSYYVKLENINNKILKQQMEESNKKLIEQLQLKEIQHKEELINKENQDRHNTILEKFNNVKYIFYIMKIKTFDNGSYIIKIGESRNSGLKQRYNEHKRNYPECFILDCFQVDQCREFEQFILSKFNIYKELQGHENEKELILIGKHLTYNIFLTTINENIGSYSFKKDIEGELYLENIKKENYETFGNGYKEILEKLDNFTYQNNEFLKIVNNLVNKLDKLEKQVKRLNPHENSNEDKKGGFIQQINPETLELIKYFDTATECIKELNLNRTSLRNAINDNTIYKDFRWIEVDRQLDPSVLNDVPETKIIKKLNIGYIAKLDKDKTKILNIYINRKVASKMNGYPNETSLDTTVKEENLSKDNYYVLYENLSEKLKMTFIKPILYNESGIGQFDTNNKILQDFTSRNECCIQLNLNTKTLNKRIKNNEEYDGYIYKFLEPKLFC
jgi:phage anti-repressor protein